LDGTLRCRCAPIGYGVPIFLGKSWEKYMLIVLGSLLVIANLIYAAPASSELVSLVVEGWRANRARVESGTGWVYLDIESKYGQKAKAIRFMWDGAQGRKRYEPYTVPYVNDRKRSKLPASPREKDRETWHVETGQECIMVTQVLGNEASISRAGTSDDYFLVGIVPLDFLMGDRLPTMIEEGWEVSAAEETVDGVRLIRVDGCREMEGSRPNQRRSVWVDPAKGYAVVRSEFEGDGHRFVLRNQLEKLESGAWFPVVTELEEYRPPKRKGETGHHSRRRWTYCTDFAFNVPVETRWFTLETVLKPGGRVRDCRVRPFLEYVYAPPLQGAALERHIGEVTALIQQKPTPTTRQRTNEKPRTGSGGLGEQPSQGARTAERVIEGRGIVLGNTGWALTISAVVLVSGVVVWRLRRQKSPKKREGADVLR